MSSKHNRPKDFGRLSMKPTWALVLAFLVPPVGAILGHVAIKDMKSGQISSLNRSLALAAVIAGWIFTGLALILLPFLFLSLGISSFFDSLTYK